MKPNESCKLIFLLIWISLTYIIALLIFTSGLLLHREELPFKSTCQNDTSKWNTVLDIHEQQCSSSPLRVILIIIDALRYDFVEHIDIPKTEELAYQNKLTVVHDLLKTKPSNSKLLKFIADPPTTTMQRIKALTTGSLSTFIDISKNFASSEIHEDNIIDLLSEYKRVVFMGDDTWIKLYPNRFVRSYPFDSFNVWDLDTVDNGIKENLFMEIEKQDWSLLVAHFLGVDHCGHRYGSVHPEMNRKLSEMNDVLKSIIEQIKHQENIVLFVVGDHGMTSTGDHGGDTENEVTSAIFAYSPIYPLFQKPIEIESVHQVDIVPTLSSILGLPIPFSNTGSVILNCIPVNLISSVSNISFLLWRNVEQITNYIKKYSQFNSQFTSHQLEFILKHYTNLKKVWPDENISGQIEKYEIYMKNVLSICQEVWVKFNDNLIIFGLICVLVISIITFFISEMKSITLLYLDGKFFVIFVLFFSLQLFIGVICAEFLGAELITTLYITTEIFLVIFIIFVCLRLRSFFECTSHIGLNFVGVFLLSVYSIVLMLPLSNSFILEEPKIILFLFISSLILINFHYSNISHLVSIYSSKSIFDSLLLCLMYRAVISYAKCRGEEDYQCQIAEPLKITNCSGLLAILSCIGVVVFEYREHKKEVFMRWISITSGVLISLYWICEIVVLNVETDFSYVNKIPGILLISLSVLLCLLYYNPLMEYFEEYSISSSQKEVNSSINVFRKSFANARVLIYFICVTILGQLYAIPVLFMMMAVQYLASFAKRIPRNRSFDVPWSGIMLWGLSCVYWFYVTGHNTSFSGIQWNAAFIIQKEIGSSTLMPGVLVVLNTFISQIVHGLFIMLPLVSPFLDDSNLRSSLKKHEFLQNAFTSILRYFIFFSIRMFSTMLSAYIHRRHLMMWGVFAPKFIFEAVSFAFVIIPSSLVGFLFIVRVVEKIEK